MKEKKVGSSGIKKFLWSITLLSVVAFFCFMMFAYYASYSDGVRSGFVIEVSRKGFLFKTLEGELNVQTFGSRKTGESPVSETFEFSVHQNAKQVYKALEEVSLSGERVNLHYKEMFIHLPWRGETKHFVVDVERTKQAHAGATDPVGHELSTRQERAVAAP